jgi:hypothetical protein
MAQIRQIHSRQLQQLQNDFLLPIVPARLAAEISLSLCRGEGCGGRSFPRSLPIGCIGIGKLH